MAPSVIGLLRGHGDFYPGVAERTPARNVRAENEYEDRLFFRTLGRANEKAPNLVFFISAGSHTHRAYKKVPVWIRQDAQWQKFTPLVRDRHADVAGLPGGPHT